MKYDRIPRLRAEKTDAPDAAAICGGLFAVLTALMIVCAGAAHAVVWPPIALTQAYSGFNQPVHVAHAGDGSGRLFVVVQAGRVRVVKNYGVLATPFLDISSRVSCCGERGLLSIAFPPQFGAKGYFYVFYTDLSGNLQISRFTLTANPDVADPASEVKILSIPHPTFANHNGGQIAFGPDGFLYIGTGDGGGAGDPFGNGQSLSSLLGKILRIDVEGPGCVTNPPTVPRNYCIPPGNPFVLPPPFQPEIWAFGLRNPWRFSFDRLTGDVYIGDVGQDRFEEANVQPPGAGGRNYGWDVMEGLACFSPLVGCSTAGLTLPVFVYDHSLGCSVTGGTVYRGTNFTGMQGIYFLADYCSGRIWGLTFEAPSWQNTVLLNSGLSLAFSSFGEDEAGNLYVTDRTRGLIYLISDASSIFQDVPPGFWAHRYVSALFNNAITTGCNPPANTNYCPGNVVTRQQMAAFIVRAAEGEPPLDYCGAGSPFADVPADDPFCRYIKRMAELGITTGCNPPANTNYCPGNVVNRQQMAAFIVRAVEGEPAGVCASPPFADVPVSNTFCKHIERLKALGVTTGFGDGTYRPLDAVARGQMAAFLSRAFLSLP